MICKSIYILKVCSIHYTTRLNVNVKKIYFGQNKRRPWHDTRGIARTRARADQEKGGLGGRWKARPKVKLRGLISPAPNSKQLVQNNFNWFNIINLDWFFFLTLDFKTNLTCSYVLLLDKVSVIMQWASVNMLYQKR